MRIRRRALLLSCIVPWGAGGCAAPAPAGERIVEVASGRELTRGELTAALRGCDFALLGELHDSPLHHERRAALVAALPPGTAVVAEHLPRGAPVVFGPDLLASLVAAGFDAKAWGWPLHEPLFAAIARAGLRLAGGNLARDTVRRIAREGEAAVPAELAALLRAAPLAAADQAALDADLREGHCGHLDARRLPAMRWAQRARDAAMALALRDAAGRPALLLAGNGHVRSDYGVPRLIEALQPGARLVSVGFVETGAVVAGAPYTHLWITAATPRDDPCAGFRRPLPA